MTNINDYFVYRIEGQWKKQHHQITGVLCQFDYKKDNEQRIIPHENTNKIRVQALKNARLNHYPPSYWLTESTEFPLDLLNQWFKSANNKIQIPRKDHMQHSVARLEDEVKCQQVTNALKRIPHFLIADGHHRYETITQQARPASFPVFIIAASQAAFQFNSLCCPLKENSDTKAVLRQLHTEGLEACCLEQADFLLSFKGTKSPLRRRKNAITVENNFCWIHNIMQRINEVQFVLTQPEIPEVVNPFVSIKVLKSDISLVIKEGLIGKRMPIKSTHFEHKPDERVLDYIANRDSCLSQTNLRTGS